MVNEVGEDWRKELMLSDRKASKVLGVTVLRAPRLTKEPENPSTNVVGSEIDLDTQANGGSASPRRNRLRERFTMARVIPLILGGQPERERVCGEEGERVVLSPRWKSSRMLRRHTISQESGLNLLLPQTPMAVSPGQTASTSTGLLAGDGGGGCGPSLDLDMELGDTVSETGTLEAELCIAPAPVPTSCPPSPTSPPTYLPHNWVPVSPTARRNPVLQRRREMIRSANKSVQILGIEARRAILNKMEEENAGRVGWSGV